MDKTEKIVRQFMSEVKPFTYKDNDGRLMTDLANFYDWLKTKEQLNLSSVVKPLKDEKAISFEEYKSKFYTHKEGSFYVNKKTKEYFNVKGIEYEYNEFIENL